jgi:hypothetical protein
MKHKKQKQQMNKIDYLWEVSDNIVEGKEKKEDFY